MARASLSSRSGWWLGAGAFAACAALGLQCGSSSSGGEAPGDGGAGSSSGPDGSGGGHDGSAHDGGGTPSDGGIATGEAASACVPGIPTVSWTNPYAGWTRGIPSDGSFFPIAVWLQGSWHATEMAALGINLYVGNNAGTDPLAASDLATLKAAGIRAIVGQDSVGLANVDDTTIVGWWMTPDEPDNAQPVDGGYGPPVAPSTLTTQYAAYEAKDGTRPIYLGLGQGVAYDGWEGRGSNAPPESQYVPASDIIDFDIYPYNNCGGDTNEQVTCGQFWLNAFGVDRLHQWSNRNQAVWTDIETTVIGAGTTTGPTPAQTRSEVWLSLIHGANGIAYFVDTWNPSFREDGIFADATMVSAVTALNAQIQSLAPVLESGNVPSLVTVTSSSSTTTIDSMVKAKGTTLYVFAAVSKAGTATGSFAIAGMTGNATATVLGENRTIPVAKGAFTDSFAASDAHVYTVDLSTATCP
ncbi:MAG TPA: hypothetical protein VGG39_28375 [Polyangiaceae bacterium]